MAAGGAVTAGEHRAGADHALQVGYTAPSGALSGTDVDAAPAPTAVARSTRPVEASRDDSRETPAAAADRRTQVATDRQAAQHSASLSALASAAERQARKIKADQWILPTSGYHLTARFGQVSGLWSTVHTGLDFASPTGTPIHAIAAGTVTAASYDGSYGNKTVIHLADGTDIWYCHQNAFAVSVGQTVAQGQLIGYVGSTGNTTGPHLHLEVHPGGGDPVDPFAALVAHGVTP